MNTYLRISLSMIMASAPLYAADFTGVQTPTDNYYSDAHLSRLNDEGVRKHAPLNIIIAEPHDENPDIAFTALTSHLADSLQEAQAPILVSRSIAYNYFFRRNPLTWG